MPEYLTECAGEAGHRITADHWEEAERKVGLLIYFGLAHPDTEVVGELVEEFDVE